MLHFCWELGFCLGVLPDSTVEVFNGVGGVNDLSKFERILKIVGKIVPVFFPRGDGVFVFAFPFQFKLFQFYQGCFFVDGG